jgi:hypothetical protein
MRLSTARWLLGRQHVDEVDDDEAADIPQAQLAAISSAASRLVCKPCPRCSPLGGAGRVDIDGHQRFRRIDNQGAAGGQAHLALEGRLDLAFDLEAVEQGDAVFVELDALLVLAASPC